MDWKFQSIRIICPRSTITYRYRYSATPYRLLISIINRYRLWSGESNLVGNGNFVLFYWPPTCCMWNTDDTKTDIGLKYWEEYELMKDKRCPECFTNFSYNETECPSCGQKVKKGKDGHGYAKKPINWNAYLSFLFSLAALIAFIWWAFFKSQWEW